MPKLVSKRKYGASESKNKNLEHIVSVSKATITTQSAKQGRWGGVLKIEICYQK